MIAEFIIMFREALEIAFVIGIMLAYLHKTGNQNKEKHIWLGLVSGLFVSVLFAFVIISLGESFTKQNEEFFEGIFMIVTAVLVTWLVTWMVQQKNVVQELKEGVKLALSKKDTMALVALTFFAVIREGFEIVLFMYGIFLNTGGLSIAGSVIGVGVAIAIGFGIFEYSKKFNIGLFFKVTTVILVLLAAGLFSQGIHELQEAGTLPTYIEHVYDINPPVNEDGSYPILHEKGSVGAVFKGLVGYDGAPSLLQVLSYLGYVLAVFGWYKFTSKK